VKRFHFRLDRLLELRSYRERQWLAKLAIASGHCIRLSHRISETGEAARGAFYTDIKRGHELDLSLLTYREHYINRMNLEQRKLKKELEEKLRRRSEVQKNYQKVLRDKKVLENLKSKRESEYYAQAKLEEFKITDDLNSSQFIRKSL
jgi:flagellar FliJ protein